MSGKGGMGGKSGTRGITGYAGKGVSETGEKSEKGGKARQARKVGRPEGLPFRAFPASLACRARLSYGFLSPVGSASKFRYTQPSRMLKKFASLSGAFLWSIRSLWSIRLVSFNQTNETDQMNQTDQISCSRSRHDSGTFYISPFTSHASLETRDDGLCVVTAWHCGGAG